MTNVQYTEDQDYSASARFDKFDGYDRGDTGADDLDQGSECIGRMRAEFGGKVEVFHAWSDDMHFYSVTVTNTTFGTVTTLPADDEHAAKALARWFLNGCPD